MSFFRSAEGSPYPLYLAAVPFAAAAPLRTGPCAHTFLLLPVPCTPILLPCLVLTAVPSTARRSQVRGAVRVARCRDVITAHGYQTEASADPNISGTMASSGYATMVPVQPFPGTRVHTSARAWYEVRVSTKIMSIIILVIGAKSGSPQVARFGAGDARVREPPTLPRVVRHANPMHPPITHPTPCTPLAKCPLLT